MAEIKEFHFHVYWFQNDENSVTLATSLRERLLKQVSREKNFVAVCHGVTEEMLPGLEVRNIPPVNDHPIGPHPCGSFEVWVPKESFSQVMSFFMRERGLLSILIHPLTQNVIEDHTKSAMWLGEPFRLNLNTFSPDEADPPQYPELKLGYSAPESQYGIFTSFKNSIF
mmetsp:Transcript_8706/g.10992  ORF Transcript_8706/g.10992 Transcript_8706/m.10992 type:complete len:169 (-) Transcript_8706:322-828(-)